MFRFSLLRAIWFRLLWVLALVTGLATGLVSTAMASHTGKDAKQVTADRAAVAWPGFPTALQKKLSQALRVESKQGGNWHTRWLDAHGRPVFTNRLALSDSPYLLEHAHNPVNWYDYGPEAFAAAKAQNKPLFISIGYASCHWCHVMARESFESAAGARLLNTSFIAVKVDRQQQPGLDHRYQIAVAVLNHGQTGWPASVFALPDGQPFYTRLYQPEAQFLATLKIVDQMWRDRRPEVDQEALKLTALMRRVLDQQARAATLDDTVLEQTVQTVAAQFDPFQGGFGDGVKFPQATRLLFLLDQLAHARAGGRLSADQSRSLRAELELTLAKMARGGVFDQIGGGFFRYSTSPDWQVPHFEKMAYGQAMLAQSYLKAGLVLGDAQDWRIAERTLDFVIRRMTAPDGGFVAALDADSRVSHRADAHHGESPEEEGYFYTWTPKEVAEALPPNEARLAERYWSITSGSGGVDGRSVPHRGSAMAEAALARSEGLNVAALTAKMAAIRTKLQVARQLRPAPSRDENRILSWNGLLIQSLADGGRLLGAPRFITAAQKAADFILQKMRLPDGTLAHGYNRGVANGRANLADHADFALGLVALYDATGQQHWLTEAKAQAQVIERDFSSPNGGFYDHIAKPVRTGAAGDVLNLPLRPIDDGEEPAGNAQVLALLLALAERTGDATYREAADQVLASFSGLIVRDPSAFTGLLTCLTEAREGAVGNLVFTANGEIRIEALRSAPDAAEVRLRYTSPWHSNAHQASPGLIPTTITVEPSDRVRHIHYSPGREVKLAFSSSPLNLYTGTVVAAMTLNPAESGAVRISVQIQACSDAICLAPEHLSVWLPPWLALHGVGRGGG